MTVIAPAITTETPEDYKAAIERVQGFATRLHLDISDGEFAPTNLVEPGQIYWPGEIPADIHAMVARPSDYVQSLVELKPHLLIFHAEVEEDLKPTFEIVKQAGIKTGIALLKPTVPKTVQPLIEMVDHVMIFSGELGKYGGVASLMQLEKVRLIRVIKPSVEIGWDGGAGVENVFSLTQGGIDVINVGGEISRADDPAAIYKKMNYEISRQSVF